MKIDDNDKNNYNINTEPPTPELKNDQKLNNNDDYETNNPESKIQIITNPIWLSVSESAKLGGVQTKTIRRAIKSNNIRFKILGNRYLIELKSLIVFMKSNKKLENKFNSLGIGQYIEKWR